MPDQARQDPPIAGRYERHVPGSKHARNPGKRLHAPVNSDKTPVPAASADVWLGRPRGAVRWLGLWALGRRASMRSSRLAV